MNSTHYFAIAYSDDGDAKLFECLSMSRKDFVAEVESRNLIVSTVCDAEEFEEAIECFDSYDADIEEAYDYLQSNGEAYMI